MVYRGVIPYQRAANAPTMESLAASAFPSLAPRPRTPEAAPDPVERAREAGITAVWTGSCSGTVELGRLAGPTAGRISDADAAHFGLPGPGPWTMSTPAVRTALYEQVLTRGTQFDCYRLIDLTMLSAVWPELDLPDPVRCEWEAVLRACGLLGTPCDRWSARPGPAIEN